MDWKLALLKYAKALGAGVVGALIAALVGSNAQELLEALAALVASRIPLVGGLAKGFILSFLTAAIGSAILFLENVRKHWGD